MQTILQIHDYVLTNQMRQGAVVNINEDSILISLLSPDGTEWEPPFWIQKNEIVHLDYNLDNPDI